MEKKNENKNNNKSRGKVCGNKKTKWTGFIRRRTGFIRQRTGFIGRADEASLLTEGASPPADEAGPIGTHIIFKLLLLFFFGPARVLPSDLT